MSSSNNPPSLVVLHNNQTVWIMSRSLFRHADWRALRRRFEPTEAPAMATEPSDNATELKPGRKLVKRKNRPPRASAPPIKTPYPRPDTNNGGESHIDGGGREFIPDKPDITHPMPPLLISRPFPLRGSILPYTRQGKAQARRNVSKLLRSSILDMKVRENHTIAAFVQDMSFTKMMEDDEKLGEALAAMMKGKSGDMLMRDQIEELEEQMRVVEIGRERMIQKHRKLRLV